MQPSAENCIIIFFLWANVDILIHLWQRGTPIDFNHNCLQMDWIPIFTSMWEIPIMVVETANAPRVSPHKIKVFSLFREKIMSFFYSIPSFY